MESDKEVNLSIQPSQQDNVHQSYGGGAWMPHGCFTGFPN